MHADLVCVCDADDCRYARWYEHQQEQQRLCASTERVMRRLMHWGTSGAFHRWREWVEEVHRARNLLNKVLATLRNRTFLRRLHLLHGLYVETHP